MFHNLTPKAQQVFALAKKVVLDLHQKCLGTDHLLLGLLELKQGIAVRVLERLGLDIETVHDALKQHIAAEKNKTEGFVQDETIGEIVLTPRVRKVLALAEQKAKELRHTYIGTEHLLLGLLAEGKGLGAKVLKTLDIDPSECCREILSELIPGDNEDDDDMDFDDDDEEVFSDDDNLSEDPFGVNYGENRVQILKNFGTNLTLKAQKNELDPVIGREREIERLIQILCRRTKNNPVLIGEAGVGKTAVVEGLAQRIVQGKVPDLLLGKCIFSLDLALLLSGTKYRGQFEERLKRLMDELNDSNIILFLDELHTIVGAGSAEGSMDASNILKPALARGQIQCIGATTLSEYRKYIEKDTALNRRFQSILVEPPSSADTLKILEGLKSRYEAFHSVHYSESILKQSVGLTQRYITDRCFPDKAIDLLDEAGARTHILGMDEAPSTTSLDKAITAAKDKKAAAIYAQQFEEAARWRDEERALMDERDDLIQTWRKQNHNQRVPVKEETLQRIIFDWTGVPLERMGAKETQRYLNLDKILSKEVIGQTEAIQVVARALKRSRADLKDPRRPIGSFLFLGPTGVGKTHLVKILAEQIYGSRDAVVQLDMSEYMEKHTVSRLIGSPPGYIGHEEGGQLTEMIRRKPYALVLFDEIEKAHPDVIQILLQVLEEGRLTDSLGRVVDFKNTIIIMTSNVGAQELQRSVGLGFGITSSEMAFEQLKTNVQSAMKNAFSPEFLNRINDIVIFRSLDRKHMQKIVDLELKAVEERLQKHSIYLHLGENAKQFLIDKGFDEKLGARPLKRAIERYVEDVLADALLAKNIKSGQRIKLEVDKKHNGLTLKKSSKLCISI